MKFAIANEMHCGALRIYFISRYAEHIISRRLARHFKLGSAEHFIFPHSFRHTVLAIAKTSPLPCLHIFKEYKAKMAESIEHDLL